MAKVLWVQKQDIGPRARGGHAMAFDAARQRVVLFGGDSVGTTLLGDTWTWDGENWTEVQDIGPSTRCFHAVAYDSARARVVLFGGESATGTLADTWEWDGSDWAQVADTGPSARSRHAMTFDAARQRVVLFGGRTAAGAALNDTWEWDGNDWVQQEDTGPSGRSFAAMAYDSTRNRAVLFGGVGAASSPAFGDTWEWDGTAWTEEANFGPDPCLAATMVFNGASVALFGGIQSLAVTSPPKLFALSWEWDGKHWTARQDMGPGPRAFHGAAFDSGRSRLVLFGGASTVLTVSALAGSIFGDTWEQFGSAPATGGQPALVVFHIPAGTGGSPWNTLATIVVAAVGDTLRIVNDDSVAHMPHASGSPFPHPTTDIQPGQQADYVLQSPFDPGTSTPLYDHDHGPAAQFWIRVHA
jgi:hypothetical protein